MNINNCIWYCFGNIEILVFVLGDEDITHESIDLELVEGYYREAYCPLINNDNIFRENPCDRPAQNGILWGKPNNRKNSMKLSRILGQKPLKSN